MLTGCTLSVDPSLIRGSDAGADDDASIVEEEGEWERDSDVPESERERPLLDASVAQRDAEAPPDSREDASTDAQRVTGSEQDGSLDDAQARDAQVVVVDAHVRCSGHSECGDDAFCTAAGACLARCDAQRGCVGPAVVGTVEKIFAAGDTIFWSTPIETDSLGNPLHHGRIWSWRRGTPWTSVVQHESGRLVFVVEDYIYLLRPSAPGREPDVLLRKSLSSPASSTEQLATNVRTVWKTRDHVVWSRLDGPWSETVGKELWRVSRLPASTPQRTLVMTGEGDWVASNATFAIKRLPWAPSFRFDIIRFSDQSAQGSITGGAGIEAVADEDYLYYQRQNQIRRAPFSDLNQEIILATGFMPGFVRFEPSGGWLYWYGDDATRGTRAGRTQRDALEPPQTLPTAPPYAAVIKNELVTVTTVDGNEAHIVLQPMPSVPCSSTMPCPADMTCSASMLCE